MEQALPYKDPFFTLFKKPVPDEKLPAGFASPFNGVPHPLSLLAAQQLQYHLEHQRDWEHNFGLAAAGAPVVIGKMFGVLVVKTPDHQVGYLAAFSGKLAGGNHHPLFVPPVFDSLSEGSFLNRGMAELNLMNEQVRKLQADLKADHKAAIAQLKTARRNHSNALQKKLFDHYRFLNQAGVSKSLTQLFEAAAYKNPPAGAGECAAPKLLQYAFLHHMQPLALAEFWWGLSPKSAYWKHGQFYPSCEEKCRPILKHMLSGMKVVEAPE